MDYNLAATAFFGAITYASRFMTTSKYKTFRMTLTGTCFAIFLADDAVNFLQSLVNFELSKGGTIFMLGFLGAEMLERFILLIRSLNVNINWNK